MLTREAVDKALTEEHDRLLGFRRRHGDPHYSSMGAWRDMLTTARENLRDSGGSSEEDYWTMAVHALALRVSGEQRIDDLTERRFT